MNSLKYILPSLIIVPIESDKPFIEPGISLLTKDVFEISFLSNINEDSFGLIEYFNIYKVSLEKVNVFISNESYNKKTIFTTEIDSSTRNLIPFVYNNEYTGINNKITVEYIYSNQTIVYQHDIPISNPKVIKIENSLENIEADSYLHLENKRWSISKAKYLFKGFEPYYIVTSLNQFNLDFLSIEIDNTSFSFLSDNAYLLVANVASMFPLMPVEGKNLKIPLSINLKRNNIFTFAFKDKYFVNKETFNMSKDYITGYYETDKLFFPLKESDSIDNLDMKIVFENFGLNHDRVVYSFKFKNSFLTFGNCKIADYCIVYQDVEINEDGWLI